MKTWSRIEVPRTKVWSFCHLPGVRRTQLKLAINKSWKFLINTKAILSVLLSYQVDELMNKRWQTSLPCLCCSHVISELRSKASWIRRPTVRDRYHRTRWENLAMIVSWWKRARKSHSASNFYLLATKFQEKSQCNELEARLTRMF